MRTAFGSHGLGISDAKMVDTAGARITTADRQPPRRIDRIYVTHDFPTAAVEGFGAAEPADVGQCTDHCPVLVEIDETGL